MTMVDKVLGALTGGVLGLATSIFGGKKAAAPIQPLPSATRDDAKAQAMANDELLRRKGGAADILGGVKGAEAAAPGAKLTLGS
jgi:hypothetical protein